MFLATSSALPRSVRCLIPRTLHQAAHSLFRPQLDFKSILLQQGSHQANAQARNMTVDLKLVARLYEQHCTMIQQANHLRQQRNQVAQAMTESGANRAALIEQGKQLKQGVGALEEEIRVVWEALSSEALKIPNRTAAAAPLTEQVLRSVGEPRVFDFEPKSHDTLGHDLGLFDFEAASRSVGSKFVYLQRAAALLELALQQLAMRIAMERGFIPTSTPDLAHSWVVEGCGFNPRGKHTQVYRVHDSDLCLIGTSEIALAGMLAGKSFDQAQLPHKIVAVSHCFRTEAGAAGASEKGLYRLHQFTKVEMFIVSSPEQSDACLLELVDIEQTILEQLGLHYQVIDMPAHELGASAYRKFDIEAWMPGKNEFGEVTSASNCTDYQARRLGIKMKRPDGTKEFVHTLNGTAAAIPRLIISILETHQNADGTVNVPAVLQPFLGVERIEPV